MLLYSIMVFVVLAFKEALLNCDSEIYCRGPILEKIQMSGLFPDSKQFVDMPTSKSKAAVLRGFSELPKNVTNAELRQFLADNFHRPGYELRIVIPKDWRKDPKFLENLDGRLKVFGSIIHSKWKALTRSFDKKKLCGDCLASSLSLPYPFIVPGGRFREFYYWDSYWILEGLYVSEMCPTATGMIENMLLMIESIGFIPNGSRIYYLNRSQPPLFTKMIRRYMEECIAVENERIEFIRRVINLLEKEYNYWMKERSAELAMDGGKNVTVNLYRTEHWIPRPEAYLEDKAIASNPKFDGELKRQMLYQNIASAAESGWDFSGRWVSGNVESNGLENIETTSIVPLDLNIFMLANEKILAEFHGKLDKDSERSQYYQKQRDLRHENLNLLFQKDSLWTDFNLTSMKIVDRPFYISDLSIIWSFDFNLSALDVLLKKNERILFSYPGGIPASEQLTGQQWDFPNVWAPIQQLFIEALLRHDNKSYGKYYELALNISQRFINSVYCGYELFGQFFEKYHAVNVGYPGGGGEYIVQEGFGWTNGVTEWILYSFNKNLTLPKECLRVEKEFYSPISQPAQPRAMNRHTMSNSDKKLNRAVLLGLNVLISLALLTKIILM